MTKMENLSDVTQSSQEKSINNSSGQSENIINYCISIFRKHKEILVPSSILKAIKYWHIIVIIIKSKLNLLYFYSKQYISSVIPPYVFAKIHQQNMCKLLYISINSIFYYWCFFRIWCRCQKVRKILPGKIAFCVFFVVRVPWPST
jgi:hypothetical protein